MFNNFNGLFFRTLSYPYLNPTFILLCKVSAGKGLQSSIALWKWYFSLFALDLLQDYFIRKPYPMKWEKLSSNGPSHSIRYLTELYYNPISSQTCCAVLGHCHGAVQSARHQCSYLLLLLLTYLQLTVLPFYSTQVPQVSTAVGTLSLCSHS